MTYIDDRNNPVYALNSYVFKLIEANNGVDKADYEGASPVIPVQQQPEFLQKGKPFVVYGASTLPPTHLYVCRTSSVAYNVYATTSTEVNAIANTLAHAFERQDEAASDVNQHLALQAPHMPGGLKSNVEFQTVKLSMVETAAPADEEGGYYSAVVLVEIKYIVNSDDVQTTGFTYP